MNHIPRNSNIPKKSLNDSLAEETKQKVDAFRQVWNEHKKQAETERRHQLEMAKQQLSAMQKVGMMPINTSITNQVAEVIDVYSLLEHCGDLIATGVITPPEWMKLKQLLRSPDHETVKLAKEIIDAKVQIK